MTRRQAILSLLIVLPLMAIVGAPTALSAPTGGTWVLTGGATSAPGVKKTLEINGDGQCTITLVKKNGVTLNNPADYQVTNSGTSSPEIVFTSAPAAGDTISAGGGTSQAGSGQSFTGTWSA